MKKKKKVIGKPKRLGEKLQNIRENCGLSQAEMLKKLGFDEHLFRSNISQYELGTREPNLLVLLAYARLVGISTDDLIDDQMDLPE